MAKKKKEQPAPEQTAVEAPEAPEAAPQLTGLDKAALLFRILGPNLARPLFKTLSESDIIRIRNRMEGLKDVSFDQKKQVLEEFYFDFMSKKMISSKEDLANPFAFLNDLVDPQIVYLLKDETPRIAAIALAQLPPEQVARLLVKFPQEVQGQVIVEMGNLVDIPLEGIHSIANDLAEKALGLPKYPKISVGGSESLAQVLDNLDTRTEQSILDLLRQDDPELAKEVKKVHFVFTDIALLPDDIMRDLLRGVEPADTALALKGQPQEVRDKFYNNLPERAQVILEDEMRLIEGPQPRRRVEEAQARLVDKARDLEKEGRFTMADILEADMIE